MTYKCDIPEMKSENYRIERFSISEDNARLYNMRLLFNRQGYRQVVPGTYTRLIQNNAYNPLMSDTPAEIFDHKEFVSRAEGDILINGLGLGVVLDMCLAKAEVKNAFVIEISQEIIDLVAPHYLRKYPNKITIICADAFEYKFPNDQRFNAIWHDIWPAICADNLPGMKRLHRKYSRRTKCQGSWCRWECERQSANPKSR